VLCLRWPSRYLKLLNVISDERQRRQIINLLEDKKLKEQELERAGRYADAEPLYQRSLAIREKALGRDHLHVAGLQGLSGNIRRLRGQDCIQEAPFHRH
jgi:hypothetical protein